MHRTLRIAFVAGLLAAETGAVVTLQRLGRVAGFAVPHQGATAWLLHASTEDLVAVAARLLGLGLAWWLLAATVCSVARRVVPGLRHMHLLDVITPATVRRTLDRALAVGLGASLGLASFQPAGASVRTRADIPVVRIAAPAPSPPIARPPTPRRPLPVPDVEPTTITVVVHPGDNLWVIAARELERATPGPRAGEAEIARYWKRMIAANAATLRSHDPNLIFPGEHVVLPPIEGPRPG